MGMAEIAAIWEARREESRKHSVSRVVQLYLDKQYFDTIASTGHTGKIQDYLKDAIRTEAQHRFNKEVRTSSPNENDKERADRLQNELTALKTQLNNVSQAVQSLCV